MRLGGFVLLVIALSAGLTACEEPRTGADACRRGAAASRFGRNIQNHGNATADTLDEMRCDEIERDERREARERARERREDEARLARETAQAQAQTQARLTAARRNPKAPEVGATRAEAKAICDGERGQWVDKTDKVGCKIGGVVVFACEFSEANIVKLARCTTYFEGADIADVKPRIVEKLGAVESQGVSADGFRSFVWLGGRVLLDGYARGVKVTFSEVPAPAVSDDD